MRKVTPGILDKIIELRESGKTYPDIGKELGLSASGVEWHCTKLAIEPAVTKPLGDVPIKPIVRARGEHKVRLFTTQEDELILQLAASGQNYSQIARATGRRHNSIIGRFNTLARRQAREEAQLSGD